MPCSYCGKDKVLALGLCGACYQRQRSTGVLAKKLVSNIGRACSVEGCDKPAISKRMCQLHYTRHCHHALRNTWHLIRGRYSDQVPTSWQRFQVFLSDVGERPSSRHQLRRIDEEKPYSAANIRWVEPAVRADHYSKEDRRHYGWHWRLRNVFGMSAQDYDRMRDGQGGQCAICGGQQDINQKTGKPRQLGVDHCHKTNKVRGLLCVNCNRGLGYFSDDIGRLKSAIAYLERHAAKKKSA